MYFRIFFLIFVLHDSEAHWSVLQCCKTSTQELTTVPDTGAAEALEKWDGGRAPRGREEYGEGACLFSVMKTQECHQRKFLKI